MVDVSHHGEADDNSYDDDVDGDKNAGSYVDIEHQGSDVFESADDDDIEYNSDGADYYSDY